MKKRFIAVAAVALMLVGGASPVAAEQVFPKGDFFLYSGRIPNYQKPAEFYTALKTAVPATPISIRNNTLHAYSNLPVEFKEDLEEGGGSRNAYITNTGPVMLKLDGIYDPDLGVVSGTVEFDADLKAIWHDEYWFQNDWKITDEEAKGPGPGGKSSGKFLGQIVEDRALVKFSLTRDNGVTMTVSAIYQMGKFAEPEQTEEPKPEAPENSAGVQFSAMKGQVEWRPADDPKGWRLCKLNTKLPEGAHIRTMEDSSAVLSFGDMSTFILKPETEVVITAPPDAPSKIGLVVGKIWTNTKKIFKDGTVDIDMSQAVCGIKGTTFYASQMNGVSEVKVVEGVVAFKSKTTGESMDIRGSESGTVGSDGKILKADINLADEEELWDKELGWNTDFSLVDSVPNPDGSSSVPVSAPSAESASALADQKRLGPIVVGATIILLAIIGVFVVKKRK